MCVFALIALNIYPQEQFLCIGAKIVKQENMTLTLTFVLG